MQTPSKWRVFSRGIRSCAGLLFWLEISSSAGAGQEADDQWIWGMLSFELTGGYKATLQGITRTEVCTLTVSLGSKVVSRIAENAINKPNHRTH
jgi:hypothetical protein